MKHKLLQSLMLIAALSAGSHAFAHDFEVGGIYYNIISSTDKTCKVTYQGPSASYYSNEYGGSIIIPETVTYNGTTYSVTSIGYAAFEDCTSLTSITIPNSVTSIGNYAFQDCTGLTSVTIPNSVTSIGDYAFQDCTGLTSITIGNSVTSIGNYAFDGCSGLTSITIPNSVTSIGNYAFDGCSGLTSITIPNSVTSIGNNAFDGCSGLTSITIPNSVRTIGNYAFNGCSGLKELRIEDGKSTLSLGANIYSTSYIGEGLFYDCPLETLYLGRNLSYSSGIDYGYSPFFNQTKLKSVTIENSVTSIGDYAFDGCSGLTSITIPNSVTSIGNYAFDGCSGLTSITIPNSVTSIGRSAFTSCTSLSSVIFNAENCETMGDNIYYAVFNGCAKLSSVTIGENVKSIPSYAFRGCTGLTSITIPNSVTSIGGSAFYGCSGLTSITIPNSVTSIGGSAFYGCRNLTSVTIGNSVTSIGYEAFRCCNRLTSVTIPNSVTSIGSSAFSGCSGLKELRIEDGESTLSLGYNSYNSSDREKGLFYDCPLETVYIGRSLSYDTSYYYGYSPFYNNTIESLTFGTKVLTTGGGDFNSIIKTIWLTNTPPEGYAYVSSKMNYVANDLYTSLGNVTIYPYLSSIFEVGGVKYVPVSPSERTCDAIDCSYSPNAENINLGNTVSYKGIEMTVNEIKPYVCYNNDYINNATIDYTKEIPIYAFNDCNVVNNANIKASSIGEYAFSGSATQTPATLKVEAETIANKAFEGCTAIENAEIKASSIGESAFAGSATQTPATLKIEAQTIANKAFEGCTAIENAEIKATSIGKSAFSGCSCLSGIVLPNAVTSLGANAFYNCSSLSSVSIGTGIPAINDYTFYGCSSLPEINIPSNVTSIGNYVFDGCTSLANVTIADRETELTLGSNGSEPMFASCPLNTVYIGGNINYPTSSSSGYSPFYRNTSLETVTITDKETEISENEFYGCAGLKNVTMGDGVETIGNWAFSGCSSLDYFSFGSGMKTIGEEAFSDCTAMTKLISSATVPPTCGTQALDDINKWNCELVVPKTVVSAYQAADQWKEFFFITGSDDLVSGVEETLIDGYEDEHAVYYNLQGVKVENPERGLYIKKQGNKVTKVVL